MIRKNTLRSNGTIWNRWEDGWSTRIHDRYLVTTWKFGSVHQSKVFVDYEFSKINFMNKRVGIHLKHQSSRKLAMQRGLDWVLNESKIYVSPNKLLEYNKNIYRKYIPEEFLEAHAYDHLLFTVGNGYSWLDGIIISNSPDEEIILDKDDLYDFSLKINNEKYYKFYPISMDYSLISLVPNDVMKEWLEFCIYGLNIVSTKSNPNDLQQRENVVKAAQLIKELRKLMQNNKK